MSARAVLGRSFTVLGGRMPLVIALLIGLTLFASVVGAVTLRNGITTLMAAGILVPLGVWNGELWRLVTWVFFETDGLGLVFACLALFWFGRDLCNIWGPVRFLAVYAGFAAAAAGATCLLARLWPELMGAAFLGPWPLVDALIIAWAVVFPHRDILVYFVLPLRGRHLMYATVGGTVLFALLYGVSRYVPHFLAQGLMLAWLRGLSLERLWLNVRFRLAMRGWQRRASHLRPVERRDEHEPPRWLH